MLNELGDLIKALPQGAAVVSVVTVVGMILLRYIPTLIKEFRDTIQGIVVAHHEDLKSERELFRVELRELRTLFSTELKTSTDAFVGRNEVLSSRLDLLTTSHRDLREAVDDLKGRLEA